MALALLLTRLLSLSFPAPIQAMQKVKLDHSERAESNRNVPELMNASVVGRMPLVNMCNPAIADSGVQSARDAIESTCGGIHAERIKVLEVPTPHLSHPGQAIIRVNFSSVNPCNWKGVLANPVPLISGNDFAGVVQDLEPPCNLKPGDEVWGMANSCYAEYIVTDCAHIGLKPEAIDMAHAAAIPLVALTGLQGLRYAGAPWNTGPTVLVLGGSSGTGSAGIQLARANGAGRIISTCSPDNFDIVRGFGADEVIDYHSEDWWEVLPARSVDIVYDCVCLSGTGNLAYPVLKDGGYFLTIQQGSMASQEVASTRPSVTQYSYLLDRDHTGTDALDYLKDLVEGGELSMPIDETYELDQVGAAFESSIDGHTVGKISIHVGDRGNA